MRSFVLRLMAALALLLPLAGAVHAGSDLRRGTDGALELQIPVGARGSALGGTVIGDVSGVEALYWNPAGIGSAERTEVLFSHTSYIADMNVNYIGVITKMGGGLGVFGFNAKVLSIGDIIETTEEAPDGTGNVFSPTFAVLGATWAKQFTDRVLFGGTLNYVSERIMDIGASGLAFDFGVQYMTDWKGLRFGMAMKNIGPSMEFSGAGLETNLFPEGSDPTSSNRTFRATSAAFQMPSNFTLAGSFDAHHDQRNRLVLLGAFQNNNFTGDVVRAGAEWNYRDQFALRGAWYGSYVSTVDLSSGEETSTLQSGEHLYSGYSLGAGASVRMGDGGRMGVDFAWRPVREFFDDTVEMSLKLTF